MMSSRLVGIKSVTRRSEPLKYHRTGHVKLKRKNRFKSILTIFIEIFSPTTACFEKPRRERSEILDHTLQVYTSRIGAWLAEKVKISDELKDMVEGCN